MSLYKGMVRSVAGLLLAVMLAATVFAVPLPETPPEVDSTPVSHEEEPEGFRSAEILPQKIPETTSQSNNPTTEPISKAEKQSAVSAPSAGLDTGSVLLIGAAIWYLVILIGVTGGRRGVGRRGRGRG